MEVIEHRAQRRVCGCGVATTAAFPAEASAPTCYGPGVAALGAYLLGRQHLPVERAAECLADCFGAPVSTGYLAPLLPNAAGRLEGFLALVGKELAQAEVAHFDETGGRVKGKLWWIHVACTDFGWTIGDPSPVGYRMVNRDAGGLWDTTGLGGASWAVFYVQVDDVAATIAQAEVLGATVLMPLVDNGTIEFAHLADQQGNRLAVWPPKTPQA